MTCANARTLNIWSASNSELARRLGWSPQLLNKRINTGKFSVEEWQQIAAALGAKARVGFVFPDGKEI